jgi:hypothetical protein
MKGTTVQPRELETALNAYLETTLKHGMTAENILHLPALHYYNEASHASRINRLFLDQIKLAETTMPEKASVWREGYEAQNIGRNSEAAMTAFFCHAMPLTMEQCRLLSDYGPHPHQLKDPQKLDERELLALQLACSSHPAQAALGGWILVEYRIKLS